MADVTRQATTLERHTQTVLGGIIFALVCWTGWQIQELIKTQERLIIRVEVLQHQVGVMNNQLDAAELASLRRTVERHDKQFDEVWPRLREIKERVQRMEPETAGAWQHQ